MCFLGARRAWWFDRFLAPGFRHCFMLGYVAEFGAWLLYDVQLTHSTIAVVSDERAGMLLGMAMDEGDVLSVTPEFHVKHLWWHRIGFWCVPAAVHLLGMRCVAVTPRGLHRYLVRKGAKSLKGSPSGFSVRQTETAQA